MSEIAIKAEGISKAYQIGEFSTGTITQDIERWYAKVRGKEDKYLKVGEANDRTTVGKSNIVWSLKDVSFEINQGEAVGIIGRNGAGKSTLLKVLSRVTSPTTGSIKAKGRIASLLEVGTGFHPELTGRENIYLNGAILGMRKLEIKRKFDEIVGFSGVERYIDTPVKRYSSGMYVRLAFAVAAHLESEILIVDEVLAVGDIEFQKKCLGKMNDVSKGEGRTVLFVSHNMASIKQLCTKGIVLDKGNIGIDSMINDAVEYYKQQTLNKDEVELLSLIAKKHESLDIKEVLVNNSTSSKVELNTKSNTISVEITGSCKEKLQLNLELKLISSEGVLVSFYSPGHINGNLRNIQAGDFHFADEIQLPENMANGDYYINIDLCYPNVDVYLSVIGISLKKNNFTNASGKSLNYNDIGFFYIK